MAHTIGITLRSNGDLDVDPSSKLCSVSADRDVEWSCSEKHWRVVFGPQAPVTPRVAGPSQATLRILARRPEDYGHCKYTVVIWTGKEMRHLDPELIVDA